MKESPHGNSLVAAYRKRRSVRRLLIITYFLVSIGGTFSAVYLNERKHSEELEQLLENKGIPINLGDSIVIVDSENYAAIRDHFVAEGVSKQVFDELLLRSANAGDHPPTLGTLALQDEPIPNGGWLVIGCTLLMFFRSIYWRGPPRIALLRPFGSKRVSSGLRRLVKKNLVDWGHIITLSDKHLKYPSWLRQQLAVWVIFSPAHLLMGPISILLWPLNRQLKPNFIVKKEKDIIRFGRLLNNTFNLNYFATLALFDRIRKVSSTDEYWKRVVDRMIDHAAVIVVDLTIFKPGVCWELERIATRELTCQTVLIAMDQQGKDAERLLAEMWPVSSPCVHYYSRSGILVDERRFTEDIAMALANKISACNG